jgi:hypothetical protein
MEKITQLSKNTRLIQHNSKIISPEPQPIFLRGLFRMEHHIAETGKLDIHEHPNLITNVGFNFIGDVIGAVSQPSEMNHIGVGSGTTAANVTDTDLETIIGARLSATFAGLTDTTFSLAATFGAGVSTGAWTEAGCFNAVSSGVMLNHLIFTVVNKAAGDSITATFTFTLS